MIQEFITVPNLEKWQHYKDRCPPWIKLHRDILNDYNYSCLQDASKLHLLMIWLLASQMDNKIPADEKWISGRINATTEVNIKDLILLGFLEYDSKTLARRKQNDNAEAEAEAEAEKECGEKKISQPRIPYKKIISYLNEKAGSEYSHTTSATKRFIKARWNEGHREKDFFIVIENKCSEWRTNPNMIQYLRPQTLFGTKFESYLQQKKSKTQQNRCRQCIYNQRDPCKNLNEKSFDPLKCTSFSPI